MQLSSTCLAAAAFLLASSAAGFAGPAQVTRFPGGVIVNAGPGASPHHGRILRHAAPRDAFARGHRGWSGAPGWGGHRAPFAHPAIHARGAAGWTRLHGWTQGARDAGARHGWSAHPRHDARRGQRLVSGGGMDAPLLRSFAEPPLAPTAHYVVSVAPQVIYVGAPPRQGPNVRVVSGSPGVRATPPAPRQGCVCDPDGTVWQEY